jgi:hypothetical protein
VFAMIVLVQGLARVYCENNFVTIPMGMPVAMKNSNNYILSLNDVPGFTAFMARYQQGLDIEKTAVEDLD